MNFLFHLFKRPSSSLSISNRHGASSPAPERCHHMPHTSYAYLRGTAALPRRPSAFQADSRSRSINSVLRFCLRTLCSFSFLYASSSIYFAKISYPSGSSGSLQGRTRQSQESRRLGLAHARRCQRYDLGTRVSFLSFAFGPFALWRCFVSSAPGP